MIHAKQVKDPMQHENPHFRRGFVAKLGRLLPRAVERDRNFAKRSVASFGGEGKHISRAVFRAELPVEAPEFPISGNQAAKRVSAGHLLLKAMRKLAQFFSGQRTWGDLEEHFALLSECAAVRA